MAVQDKVEWEIDTDLKQKDKRAFMRAITEVTDNQDESTLYPHLAKIVKRWPYDYDPGEPASYDELYMSEFQEVLKRVLEMFQGAVTGAIKANVSGDEVPG